MNNAIALDREIANSKSLNAVIGVVFFVLATAFGAYVRIPVPGSPVPITLQTFFVILSGAILGKRLGVLSQALYIFLGAAGLPVFQGYGSGLAHVFGPTGGYLMGFMAASFLMGKILKKEPLNMYKITASLIAGNFVLYGFGIIWLMVLYRISLTVALAVGFVPFIAVETAKIFAAAFIYRAIAVRAKNIFS